MINSLEKLTIGHFFYVLGAGAAAGFLFVLLDRYLISPVEPKLGLVAAGPVI
jgi:hypothetical protein